MPAWAFDTSCRGIVTADDVPEILREIAREMPLTELARQIGISHGNMSGYYYGKKPMGLSVGRKLIEWLDKRYAQKKEAVSAATDTTKEEKEITTMDPSIDIVSQVDKKELDAAQARIDQLERELAELRRVQGQQVADDDTIAVLEGRVASQAQTICDLHDQVDKLREEHLRDLETIRDLAVRALGLEARA